jgi:HAD superfamily hydrolase (TIGR01509 family)
MAKAIIFDCFGVLATDELISFHQQYFGSDPALMVEAKELSSQVDAGRGSYDAMLQRLADMANIPLEVAKTHIEHNVPDERLFAYIRHALMPRYKVGLLSNAGENWLDEIFTPAQIAVFDSILLSYQVGYTKPDVRIYREIAGRLGIAPTDCLMIDDQERYCTGAEQAGMQAILYRGFSNLEKAMSQFN